MRAPVKYRIRPIAAAVPSGGANRPRRRPSDPAALAVPSQGHHERGTPYSVSGSTTHEALRKTERAENPTQRAAATVTMVCAVDMGTLLSVAPGAGARRAGVLAVLHRVDTAGRACVTGIWKSVGGHRPWGGAAASGPMPR